MACLALAMLAATAATMAPVAAPAAPADPAVVSLSANAAAFVPAPVEFPPTPSEQVTAVNTLVMRHEDLQEQLRACTDSATRERLEKELQNCYTTYLQLIYDKYNGSNTGIWWTCHSKVTPNLLYKVENETGFLRLVRGVLDNKFKMSCDPGVVLVGVWMFCFFF